MSRSSTKLFGFRNKVESDPVTADQPYSSKASYRNPSLINVCVQLIVCVPVVCFPTRLSTIRIGTMQSAFELQTERNNCSSNMLKCSCV